MAARGRGLSTMFNTNFSMPFDAARAEALVRSGLTMLGVSIDGARQASYEQYRVKGRLELVVRNCRLVADAKRRLGSATPRMNWSFHLFPFNVGDVADAEAQAAALGMEFHVARGRVVGPDWDPEERFVAHEHAVVLEGHENRCRRLVLRDHDALAAQRFVQQSPESILRVRRADLAGLDASAPARPRAPGLRADGLVR